MTFIEFETLLEEHIYEILARAQNVYHYTPGDIRELRNPYDLANIMPDNVEGEAMYDYCTSGDIDEKYVAEMIATYAEDIAEFEAADYSIDCGEFS